METIRYMLDKKINADPDLFNLGGIIIKQVQRRWAFTKLDIDGYVCIAEQENDKSRYNSHTARYGFILAMYYESGAPSQNNDNA